MNATRASCFLAALVSAACRAVSPDPESMRVEAPAVRELSAEDVQRRDKAIEAAVTTIVQRRYGDAEAAAERALSIDPTAARAHAILGIVQQQKADLDEPPDLFLLRSGEARLRLAQRLQPDDPFVAWTHAVFLAGVGHLSAAAAIAESALERATDAAPNERAALLGIAGTYRYELGEERAALPHLQAYVALRPEDATAHFRLGVSLLRIAEVPQGIPPASLLTAQRQAEAAAKVFLRCVELAPGDEHAALAIGTAWLRAHELAKDRGDATASDLRKRAEQQFRAVASAFPDSAEPHFRLGVLAEEGGDAAAARAAYHEALTRDPYHEGSLLNLAAFLDEAGELLAARELLERVAALDAGQQRLSADERRRVMARLQRR